MRQAGAITARTVIGSVLATWPRRIVVGSLLLIPVLVVVLGGFAFANPHSQDIPAGEAVDLGPLIIRPTAFFVSAETNRFDLEYWGAQAYLGVLVEVENLTDSGHRWA
ncbi:MAG: hypothetical protein ACK5KU_05920 [Beutenbergiaceae bacterium]